MTEGGEGDESVLPYERTESERIEDYVISNETVQKSVDEWLDMDASVRQDFHIVDGADLEDLDIDAGIDLDARVRVDLDVDNGADLEDAEQDKGAKKVVGERVESMYVNPLGYVSEEDDGEQENDEDACEDTDDSETKDQGYFTLGMTFADVKDAREAINMYGVKFGYKLRFEKNEKSRLRVRCINDNACPFKILVSKNGGNAGLALKTAYLEHNCCRQREVPSASQGFIAKYFKDLLHKNPKFRVKDMQTEISKHLKLHVSEYKCKRAKKMIKRELEGSCKQEFVSLSAFTEMVKESNPGSKCEGMPVSPGKKRVRASNEQRSSAKHVSRRGQTQRCSICKAIGHKKSFCPTQSTQATGMSQSCCLSKPKKTVPRRHCNASNKISGIGCHVDLSSGGTTINLGQSSQGVINEEETLCINDPVVRGLIPNEREINQAKRKHRDISISEPLSNQTNTPSLCKNNILAISLHAMAEGGEGYESMLPYERMESQRIEDYVILNDTVEKSVDEGLDLDTSVRQDLHTDDGADLEDLDIDAGIDVDSGIRVDLDVDNGADLEDAEKDEGAKKVVGERVESIYVNPIGYVSEEEDGEQENDEDACEDTNDSETKDQGYFTLGMAFADVKEAREAINVYGVKFGYKLRFEKNEKSRLRVRCINDNKCPFKILVSKNGENAGLALKTAYLEHNCCRQREVPSASQGFIAKYFKDLIYKNPKFKVKDMQTEISKNLKLHVSEYKCKRAKKIIMHELEGSCKQEFASLTACAKMVKESNTGGNCEEMPGRPGKKRVRASNEQRSSANHMSRKGQIQRCSICKATGHKKSYCPTQSYQATGTSQSSSTSKPKKMLARKEFNASNKTSGIGCHVDLSIGGTTINPVQYSQRVINEGETPRINDPIVRGPIPSEREINLAKRKLNISFSGEGFEVRRPLKKGKGKHEDTAVLDAEKSVGSIAKGSSRSRGVKNKPKAETETSDCEVICTRSVSNGRVLRRPRGSTTEGLETGKLDSGKFEIHIESIWRVLSEEKKNEFAYLNSLWFSLHSKGGYKAKVLSWIKKMDIFSKKYVFVPIVQWGHWSLLIFCHFGENSEAKSQRRCMLLLDSLQNAHSKQLEPGIRRFVYDIVKTEERPENKEQIKKLPLLIPKVPQQRNSEECGFFVLYYINQFLKSDLDNFIFSTGCTHFMKEDWFTPEDVECFVKTLDSATVNDCSDYSYLNCCSK